LSMELVARLKDAGLVDIRYQVEELARQLA
jgi:hypothetical protein